MKIILACIVALALATHPVSHSLVNEINSRATTWTAMEPEENPFSFWTLEEIKGMMGTKLMSQPEIKPKFSLAQLEEDLPDNYEFSGKCEHAIRDQARCGSCWAFGASEALSDRFCAAGVDVILSPEELVECESDQYACNGGYLNLAWNFLEKHGIHSDACYPYTSDAGSVGKCHTACADSEDFADSKTNFKCVKGSVVHPTKPDDIKREIFHNGPMEIAFTVYEDFMSYKGGVYQHTTGSMLGGHAVKVVGWGIENGVEYWKCANSWGTSWGESGFFRIKIGDCGINNQLYACTPDLSGH